MKRISCRRERRKQKKYKKLKLLIQLSCAFHRHSEKALPQLLLSSLSSISQYKRTTLSLHPAFAFREKPRRYRVPLAT